MQNTRIVIALAALTAGCASDSGTTTLTGESYEAKWGPVTVAPGEEATRCIVVDLGNPAPIKVHQLHNTLATGSHHLIVYRDDGAAASPVPVDCVPFAGTLAPSAATSPLMITQRQDEELTLPDGVAYSFGAHQMVRLEMHYLNSTDAPIVVTASSEFLAAPADQIRDEASFLFIGTPDIDLAPRSEALVESYFTPPDSLAGARYFALTGHTHRLGTDMHIEVGPDRESPGTPVYAPKPFSWSEPETTVHAPAFTVPPGGGFHFSCAYQNATEKRVEFGESANDEMCFFWAYYYPSKGARICVHSTAVGGPEGRDACCPADAGDTLSEFICAKLAESL